MAHFAKLDENNLVVDVIVVNNSDLINADGVEDELTGINYLKNIFGNDTKWVQTSYNSKFRKRYAAIGMIYDSIRDAFVNQKPFDSWVFDEDSCVWVPPVPYPNDIENYYTWDEINQIWVKTT